MILVRTLLLRLRSLFSKGRLEDEMSEEMRFHLEKQIEDNVKAGMSPLEARRAALLEFGGIDQIKEKCRDTRGTRFIEEFWQDLRYAIRSLRNNPGFTSIAVLTLGLGIGANSAIFSVVNGVLLSPLPFEQSDRLVRLYESNPQKGENQTEVSPADFVDWRRLSRSFEGMAAIGGAPAMNLTGVAEPDQIGAMGVTEDFFSIFRAKAALGRTFLSEEYQSQSSSVILSHGLWMRRFGGNPSLIGRTITLDDRRLEVVGVMPPDFAFTEIPGRSVVADCWIPKAYKEDENPRARMMTVIGRLTPAISLDHAQAELNVVARQLEKARPEANQNWGIRIVPLLEDFVGTVRKDLLILSGAVGFVLLIACANLANLLLARASNRQREMAVRMSLGAGGVRLVRQLLTETLVLSLLSGMIGLLLASVGVKGLIALSPQDLPRLGNIAINGRVFAFALIVSILTAIACGVVPGLRASKTDVGLSLKESGASSMGRQRRWLGDILVLSEIALALALLIGAGLLVRSFMRLQSIKLGFNPHNVLTLRIFPRGNRYLVEGRGLDRDAVNSFYKELLERVEKIPGVEYAARGALPIQTGAGSSFYVEGHDEPLSCGLTDTSTHYFRALDIPLLKGRLFTESDMSAAKPLVTIINRTMARKLWSREDVVGKWIATGKAPTSTRWTIVGVVEDTRNLGLEREPRPQVYIPYPQKVNVFSGLLLLRTIGDPLKFVAPLRSAVWSVDKDQPASRFATMEELIAQGTARRRFNLVLIGIFALLASVLAAVGVYGVMAYIVSGRTHEIGIRMALGAQNRDVMRLILGRSAVLVIVGEALGMAGALVLNRVMEKMVFGITTTDPISYILVALTWALVALLASYLPARRAARVDPMFALRYE